jgi:hypothetical protein
MEERIHPGARREEGEALEELREAVHRVAARQRKRRALGLERVVVLAGIRDVLADALVAAAAQVEHGRLADELRRGPRLEALELVGLDLEREVANAVVGRHAPGTVRVRPEFVY